MYDKDNSLSKSVYLRMMSQQINRDTVDQILKRIKGDDLLRHELTMLVIKEISDVYNTKQTFMHVIAECIESSDATDRRKIADAIKEQLSR